MLITNHVARVVILGLVIGNETRHISWDNAYPSRGEGVPHVVVKWRLVVRHTGRDLHLGV